MELSERGERWKDRWQGARKRRKDGREREKGKDGEKSEGKKKMALSGGR